jgi:hypothetical protein
MFTLDEEEALLADIRDGISIAVHRAIDRGRFPESAVRLDPIRLNKLAYLTIQDRDLDITFGWYKYGPAPITPQRLRREQGGIEPRPQSAFTAAEESRVPSSGSLSAEEYAYYFLRDLAEFDWLVTADDTKELLERFYREFCPDDSEAASYTDLYVQNATVQQALDVFGNSGWHRTGEDHYTTVDAAFGDLLLTMVDHPELDEAIEYLRGYEGLFKEVLAIAQEQSELTAGQQRYVSNVVRFYYEFVWALPALLVSRETVRGPNAERLRSSVEADLDDLRSDFERELHALESRAASFDLSKAEPTVDASRREHTATNRYDGTDEWTRLAVESLTGDSA